jgi:hypothetical protein
MHVQGLFSLPDPWDGDLVKWFRASGLHHSVLRSCPFRSVVLQGPKATGMGGTIIAEKGRAGAGLQGAKSQTDPLAVGCPWLVADSAMLLWRIWGVGGTVGGQAEAGG